MNKLIASIITTTAMLFANTPVRAQEASWLYIGNGDGFEFYVDTSREEISGPYWTAPAFTITPEKTKILGRFLLDCSNFKYRAKFANSESNWAKVGYRSPMAHVAENVCKQSNL